MDIDLKNNPSFGTNHTRGVSLTHRVCHWILPVILSFIFVSSGYAVEPEIKEDPFRMKTIEGEIAGKTRVNLSVQYKQDENGFYEAVIPVDEKIKLKGYKNFQDIKSGDKILAEFKEFYTIDKDGKEIRTGKMATMIQLVKHTTVGKLISKD